MLIDAATEVPMQEFALRRLLLDTYALTRRAEELIAHPEMLYDASWAGPPWDEFADESDYAHDEDEV